MSKLSERECAAGISLGALAVMQKEQDSMGRVNQAVIQDAMESFPPALTQEVNKIHVFDSCIRSVEIMEINANAFLLRDTHHDLGYNRVHAVNIWLDRGQLARLKQVIENMLQISPTKGRT